MYFLYKLVLILKGFLTPSLSVTVVVNLAVAGFYTLSEIVSFSEKKCLTH